MFAITCLFKKSAKKSIDFVELLPVLFYCS